MRFQVFHCLSAGSYFQETGHHIVDAMHFSSKPALTRYMKRVMNTTPSEYRQNSKS